MRHPATTAACAAILILAPPANAALEPVVPLDHEPHPDHHILTPLKDILAGENPLEGLLSGTASDLPIPVNRA